MAEQSLSTDNSKSRAPQDDNRSIEVSSLRSGPKVPPPPGRPRHKSSRNSSPGSRSWHGSPKVEQTALAAFSEEETQPNGGMALTAANATSGEPVQPISYQHADLLGNESSDSLHSPHSDAPAESPHIRAEPSAGLPSVANGRNRADSLGTAQSLTWASNGTTTPRVGSGRSSVIGPSSVARSESRLPLSRLADRASSSDSDDGRASVGLRHSQILSQSRRGSGVSARRTHSRVRRGPGLALAAGSTSSKQGSPRLATTELVERSILSDNELGPMMLLSEKLKRRLMSTLQDYADEVSGE
jgi:hypothetical protein